MGTPRPPHMRFRAELRGEVIDTLVPVLANWLEQADGPEPEDAHERELVAEGLLALDGARPVT